MNHTCGLGADDDTCLVVFNVGKCAVGFHLGVCRHGGAVSLFKNLGFAIGKNGSGTAFVLDVDPSAFANGDQLDDFILLPGFGDVPFYFDLA